MAYGCRVILDSISPAIARLTTLECTYPRFIHSELMTHRMFSRNSSSSRAIPIKKMIERVVVDPVIPVRWGANQPGMQAGGVVNDIAACERTWLLARDEAVRQAERLDQLGVHKQLVNRLLEPWMWITTLISATEWSNFYALRCHKDAEDNMQKIAYLMRDTHKASRPVERSQHFPFHAQNLDAGIAPHALPAVCAARCARVSYLTHDGRRDISADVELALRLRTSGHWSPFEHVAFAYHDRCERSGNFLGWRQYRSALDADFILS